LRDGKEDIVHAVGKQKKQNLVSYIIDAQESRKQEGKRLISLVANTRLGPMQHSEGIQWNY
jgi:hypothetical protein